MYYGVAAAVAGEVRFRHQSTLKPYTTGGGSCCGHVVRGRQGLHRAQPARPLLTPNLIREDPESET